jgi:hypothetical protein
MKIRRGVPAIVLAVALATAACGSPVDTAAAAATPPGHAHGGRPSRIDPVQLHQDMRVLWEDHVVWTRLFIVSAVAGLPDTDATAGRLLQNQADIGQAIATFYGDAAGAQLEALLRDHILIAADIVAAAKAGDAARLAERRAAWYANADDIAAFLAAANPAWPVATLQDMMRTHLDQTLDEATAQLTGDYAASIADYDHITTHILEMADTLADGIVTQFPKRFRP